MPHGKPGSRPSRHCPRLPSPSFAPRRGRGRRHRRGPWNCGAAILNWSLSPPHRAMDGRDGGFEAASEAGSNKTATQITAFACEVSAPHRA